MPPTTSLSTAPERLMYSNPALEAAEREWWARFTETEHRYCWVQTPRIQKILRAEYIRDIVALAGKGKQIVELGCGQGWIAILLAKAGCENVLGIDFSPEQIALAKRLAAEAGVSERATFQVANAAQLSGQTPTADVVLIHGFLHHLTVSEIDNVLESCAALLRPGGTLIVMEPSFYPATEQNQRITTISRKVDALLLKLGQLYGPRMRLGLMNAKELEVRALLDSRSVGEAPRGPSPKEMPFWPGEMERLLGARFTLQSQKRCLSFSHLVAQNILLMGISRPLLAAAITAPLLMIARRIEKALLSQPEPPSNRWVFEMFVCQKK